MAVLLCVTRWDWHDMVLLHQLPLARVSSFAVLTDLPTHKDAALCVAVTRSLSSDNSAGADVLDVVRVARTASPQQWRTESVWSMRTDAYGSLPGASVALLPLAHSGTGFRAAIQTHEALAVWEWKYEDSPATARKKRTRSSSGTSSPLREPSDRQDAVALAASLAKTQVSDFYTTRDVEAFVKQLARCCDRIGVDGDETRSMLVHLLALARRLRKHNAAAAVSIPSGVMEWSDRISTLSYKWTTFQLLEPSAVNDPDAPSLLERWTAFHNADMLTTFETYVALGAMRCVRVLWSRHKDARIVQTVPTLLHKLPLAVPVAAFAHWIQHDVLPAIVALSSDAAAHSNDSSNDPMTLLHDLAHWLLERAQCVADSGDLAAAMRLSTLLTVRRSATSADSALRMLALQHARPSNASSDDVADPIARLEHLAQQLTHLEHLSATHAFSISRERFAHETSATIAMAMMARVLSPAQLRNTIERHVKPYLRYCSAPSDTVLRDYVTTLTESIRSPNAPEEAQALVVLDAIERIERRVEAALTLLRSVVPPYSHTLRAFARAMALASGASARHDELQELVRLMEIQCMLLAYGVKHFDITDAHIATRVLSHILHQCARASALDDAMQLVDAFSHLRSDRAAVQFIENLLTAPLASTLSHDVEREVAERAAKALDALQHVKRRSDVATHAMSLVGVMEEAAELALALLELEEQERAASATDDRLSDTAAHARVLDGTNDDDRTHSALLKLTIAIVAAFLPECHALEDAATLTRSDDVLAYMASADFVLTDALLVDLHRLARIESEHCVLLSIATLRDPERREATVRARMRPNLLFDSDALAHDERSGLDQVSRPSHTPLSLGKGKRRATLKDEALADARVFKRPRLGSMSASKDATKDSTQRDERHAQYAARLTRFASSVGVAPTQYRSMVALLAAQHGCVLDAVRFARDVFSRMRHCETTSAAADARGRVRATAIASRQPMEHSIAQVESAETLTRISMALSWYTATHIDDVYSQSHATKQTPSQRARMLAPSYARELLQYAICVCDMDAFDETFVLLMNATLLTDALARTQLELVANDCSQDDGSGEQTATRIYARWFRRDACVLPLADTMRHATRFAIAEHARVVATNAHTNDKDEDWIASKRYVSFLVEHSADLLSLQVLLTMRAVPDDALDVVQTQSARLLSTVFQSQAIDSFLALGYVVCRPLPVAFRGP